MRGCTKDRVIPLGGAPARGARESECDKRAERVGAQNCPAESRRDNDGAGGPAKYAPGAAHEEVARQHEREQLDRDCKTQQHPGRPHPSTLMHQPDPGHQREQHKRQLPLKQLDRQCGPSKKGHKG